MKRKSKKARRKTLGIVKVHIRSPFAPPIKIKEEKQ